MDILVPDAESEYPFNPSISSIHFVGEEIHPGEGISTLPAVTHYGLVATNESASQRVALNWAPDPDAEGYEVFSTATLETPFPDHPESVSQDRGGAKVTVLPADATEAYASYDSNDPDKYYAVTSIVHGVPTLDHTLALASTGSGAEDWGYCFEAGASAFYGVGTAEGTVCLARSGDGSQAYLMAHGEAQFGAPPPLDGLGDVLHDLGNTCAGQVSGEIGAIAFEGPPDENPGLEHYAMVNGSVGFGTPIVHVGASVSGGLMQSRDQSTFGLYYGFGASFGLFCLNLPVTVSADTDPDYSYHSTTLTGSAADSVIDLINHERLEFAEKCLLIAPACTLAAAPDIGPRVINFVKDDFANYYLGASDATTPPDPPDGIGLGDWHEATSDQNGDFTTASSGSLSVTAKGIGALGVGNYGAAPTGVPALKVGSEYFDVKLSEKSIFGAVVIQDCNLGDGHTVQWLDPKTDTWQDVSDATYKDGPPRCVEIVVGQDTSPSLSQLTGTVFGLSPSAPVCESKPAIEVQPASASVTAPAEASFEVKEGVVASGCSAASIQWQESTDGGSSWNTTFGAGASGMTSSVLKIAPTAVGESGFKVRAVLTNAYGDTDSSAATLTVAPEPLEPVNLEAPRLIGTAAVGEALSCSQGRWGNAPTSFAYAWRRDGTPIGGQSASSYSVQAADAGHGLLCEVTASNIKGSVSATSNELQIPVPESAGPGGGGPGDSSGPGGGGPGSSGGAGGGGSSTTPSPAPPSKSRSTSLKCRKGYTKKKVRGKTKCVKSKKKHHHH
jgi:hypothetical protein